MKYPMCARLVVPLASLGLLAFPALAEGDVEKGKKVFNKCKACHVVDEEKNKVGPHLVNLMGRKAGAVDGFKYSDAMKESGVVWTAETLTGYLTKPKEFMPGNKMVFPGLKKEKQLVDLIAYLEVATKKSE